MALAFDSRGREIPDQTPIEIPTHLRRPLTLQEEIKRFIRIEASLAAQNSDMETFEEADDFDIDDLEIDDLPTPYNVPEVQMSPEPLNDTLDGTPEAVPSTDAPATMPSVVQNHPTQQSEPSS